MSKIEDKLVINEPTDAMLLLNALDDFYHECNMLFNNIYLSQTLFNMDKKNVFPLIHDFYDASWYKNLLISAEMLIDRFNYVLDNSKDYSYLFNSNQYDFLSFATKWNKINYIVKFNLDSNLWKIKSQEWKISQTTTWISELLNLNIKFDKVLFDEVSLENDIYEPLSEAVGHDGFQELINFITGADKNKDVKKVSSPTLSNVEATATNHEPEKEIDPNSPEGVAIEMDKLLEWILLKQATIRVRNAADRPVQKEISPVRKVMVDLIEWVKDKEIIARTYQNNKIYGFDPYEYVEIINDLKQVRELRKELNQKVDAVLEFANNHDPDTRLKPTKQIYRKYYKTIKNQQEAVKLPSANDLIKRLQKLNNELKNTRKQSLNESQLVEEEINSLLALLPFEEKVDLMQEFEELKGNNLTKAKKSNYEKNLEEEVVSDVKDIEMIQRDETTKGDEESRVPVSKEFKELVSDDEINEFINNTKNKSINELTNEKIILIDKELKKINKIISSNKKNISNLDVPITKVKDEMDQLLIWVGMRYDKLKPVLNEYGYTLVGNNYEDYQILPIDEANVLSKSQNDQKAAIKKTASTNNQKKTKNELKPVKTQSKKEKVKVQALKIKDRKDANSIEKLYQEAIKEKKQVAKKTK